MLQLKQINRRYLGMLFLYGTSTCADLESFDRGFQTLIRFFLVGGWSSGAGRKIPNTTIGMNEFEFLPDPITNY